MLIHERKINLHDCLLLSPAVIEWNQILLSKLGLSLAFRQKYFSQIFHLLNSDRQLLSNSFGLTIKLFRIYMKKTWKDFHHLESRFTIMNFLHLILDRSWIYHRGKWVSEIKHLLFWKMSDYLIWHLRINYLHHYYFSYYQ